MGRAVTCRHSASRALKSRASSARQLTKVAIGEGRLRVRVLWVLVPLLLLPLVACSGGPEAGEEPNAPLPPGASGYSAGGTGSGLTGSGLLLQLRDDEELSLAADGAFRFNTRYPSDTDYAVRVAAAPSAPIQHCTLRNAAGRTGSPFAIGALQRVEGSRRATGAAPVAIVVTRHWQ